MDEEVSGAFKVSLTSLSFPDNPAYSLLQGEAIVTIEENDFRIKQVREVGRRKEITALSIFFDLNGERQDEIYGGTKTFDDFATFIFKNTGWTFVNIDITGSKLIPNFGEANVPTLIKALCSAFECEYRIMPDKQVIFAKQIGPDNDFQYRYGYNIKTLSKNEDTTNLKTQITGRGGNGLVVTYTSPNHTQFGIIKADPITNNDYTHADSMTEFLKTQIVDYPEVTYELDSVELTERELGERIWLIHEIMGIEFQTRILSKKMTLKNGKLKTQSVVLGNAKPKKISDILASQKIEIDMNAKEYRSRIDQTNRTIELEVSQLENGLVTANALIALTAEQIENKVSRDDYVVDHNGLLVRMSYAESTITQQADLISSKVDSNGVYSLIRQWYDNVTIEAQKINLLGITNVANRLNIGSVWNESEQKGIYFRGTGAVSILSNNVDEMSINVPLGTLTLDASAINFSGNVYGLYARFG